MFNRSVLPAMVKRNLIETESKRSSKKNSRYIGIMISTYLCTELAKIWKKRNWHKKLEKIWEAITTKTARLE